MSRRADSPGDTVELRGLARTYPGPPAVQADYEQQLVTANQQALADAVSQYRATYAKELTKLPALLRTAKATPSHASPAA